MIDADRIRSAVAEDLDELLRSCGLPAGGSLRPLLESAWHLGARFATAEAAREVAALGEIR